MKRIPVLSEATNSAGGILNLNGREILMGSSNDIC